MVAGIIMGADSGELLSDIAAWIGTFYRVLKGWEKYGKSTNGLLSVVMLGCSAFGTMVDFRFATVPRPRPLKRPRGTEIKSEDIHCNGDRRW